mmetsp:Transcript_71868/g.222163  ORF Transcript_71868/g.222163 Transcript_71868/m.222163 type:complete len:231 (+) Transcript_71868:202-894(+)
MTPTPAAEEPLAALQARHLVDGTNTRCCWPRLPQREGDELRPVAAAPRCCGTGRTRAPEEAPPLLVAEAPAPAVLQLTAEDFTPPRPGPRGTERCLPAGRPEPEARCPCGPAPLAELPPKVIGGNCPARGVGAASPTPPEALASGHLARLEAPEDQEQQRRGQVLQANAKAREGRGGRQRLPKDARQRLDSLHHHGDGGARAGCAHQPMDIAEVLVMSIKPPRCCILMKR